MSVKTSARIKKRRSAEATAVAATTSSGSFATISSQRPVSSNQTNSASGSGNSNANQSLNKKHNFVGRNPNFDTDETKLLIQLWGDPKLQRTLITTHKKHAVICQLAAKMQEYGYHRSPEEITTRIKNLKCFYNRLKKDKECGLAGETEPSWKHFAEMDAIMTRPIFSVRPNEVPAPSLKYQLEKALEEHAERRKRRQENGEELSESENEEDDILLSSLVPNAAISKSKSEGVPENEADTQGDIDTRNASPTAERSSSGKRRKLSSDPEMDDEEGTMTEPRIKTEPVNQQESVAESGTNAPTAVSTDPDEDDDCMLLPLPKEEPIDVDAVDETGDVSPKSITNGNRVTPTRTVMPTLTDMLQLPKATNLLPYSGANVIIPANSISTSVAPLSGTATTSSAASGKLTPGKISLVPTNFLMQPKQGSVTAAAKGVNAAAGTQLQLLQSAINQGARLMISSGTAANPVQAATNSGLVTGPGGVKFVLVNAEQAAAAKAVAAVGKTNATAVPTATLPLQAQHQQQQPQQQKLAQTADFVTQQQQQQQPLPQQPQQVQPHQQLEKKEEKRRAQEKAREEQQSKRHMTTMRIMLRQLLNAQNEANEIQHNRLSLERERLDWEKAIGERLLTLLPTLLQPPVATAAATSAVQPGTTHQPPQFIVSGTAAATATQRLQPPKLLFTTALPMANGTVPMPHIITPSSALANSLPKVIATPVSSSTASNSVSAATTIQTKAVDICTEINEVQLVTPKLEKDC